MTGCEKEQVERTTTPEQISTSQKLIEGSYFVEFVDDGTLQTEDQIVARLNSILGTQIIPDYTYKCLVLAVAVSDLNRTQVETLQNSPKVVEVVPVEMVDLPAYESQSLSPLTVQDTSWGAKRVGIGPGYTPPSSANKRIWIIDSGIQMNHPDLTVDQTLSKSFVPTITSPGDQIGHGTGVAGIIGAKDNTEGVIGIAAGATLISLKIFGPVTSAPSSRVIAALDYICQHGRAGEVVNMSIGDSINTTTPETWIEKYTKKVANKGLFVTIAAGQVVSSCGTGIPTCGVDANAFSPARINYNRVYTVSGLRPDDTYMRISNWGNPPIDYCAPGTGIKSTTINSGYDSFGGTSFAAPHLAGILVVKGQDIKTDKCALNDPDGNADPICHLWKTTSCQ